MQEPAQDALAEVDLRAAPWEYPGPLPAASGLLLADVYAPMTTLPARRLGQARVEEVAQDDPDVTDLALGYLLLTHNVASVDARTLVVAVGSNASPAVMRAKLRTADRSPVLPIVAGTLRGVGVGHSAHVSAGGYVAVAPYADPDARVDVWAALLDEAQLAALDASEPNYVRRTVPGGLTLESGEQVGRFELYTSRWGLLADGAGRPVPAGSQDALLRTLAVEAPDLLARVRALAGLAADEDDTRAILLALGRDQGVRDRVREAMAGRGHAVASGLDHLPAAQGPVPYGETSSTWQTTPGYEAASLEVRGTGDGVDRAGEPCVVLHPSAVPAGLAHVVVRSGLAPQRPGVVARVVADPQVPAGVAALDQALRNALGVELRERVLLEPAKVARNRFADAVIAAPHYVLGRVQSADLATVEQPVCLIDPLAMSILGVASGDEVIVEGMPRADGTVAALRLKAHALPEDVRERRERLGGGGLDSRFPAARDALAVYPDLPWIFLDSAARSGLGLVGKLAAVRVRASRRQLVSGEVRELMLVLVIAFIGLASLFHETWLMVVMLAGIMVAAALLVRSRLRLRLRSVVDRGT